MLSAETLFATLDATWPAAQSWRDGPWRHRDGAGGGQRVSATTLEGDASEQALDRLLATAPPRLFMIRTGTAESRLDAWLADRGYDVKDPCIGWACRIDPETPPPPPMTGFAIWPPLSIMADLWAEGGIDAARLAVMERAQGPKTGILGRIDDRAAGVAFVAMRGDVAMLHALEVTVDQRRKGAARQIMAHAANWAAGQGARCLCLVTTGDNAPSNALYASLGMERVAQYHYRVGMPLGRTT